MGEMKKVGKLEGNSQLGRPRHRWVYSIKTVLGETAWSGVDCIVLPKQE
jgi:hypothetical protein